MPRQVALLLCLAFVGWLFARDHKLRPFASRALWIPVLWLAIITSRPVSVWFTGGMQVETPEAYLEGSAVDRNVYLLLLLSGLAVLVRRRFDWGRAFASNRWLFAYFLFCGVSVLWSDYGYVGFKRWIKDLGNVVMVLIIFSERDPVQATRAVFARCAYLALPFSVLFVKYYSDLGKYFSRSWDTFYCGVATEKNALGCLAFVFGMFLVWDLIEMRQALGRKMRKTDLWGRAFLIALAFYLIDKAASSTALVCLVLGIALIIMLRLKAVSRQVRYLGTASLVVFLAILFVYLTPGLLGAVVGLLGEDLTFTGRTDLWGDLLKEPINPLLGTGYQSFWLGSRAESYWERYPFHPNQAHNGYLEIYLNGGLIGVSLLMGILLAAGAGLKQGLLARDSFTVMRFSFLMVAVFYNWTEAMFSRMCLIWFILLLAAINCRRPVSRGQEVKSPKPRAAFVESEPTPPAGAAVAACSAQ